MIKKLQLPDGGTVNLEVSPEFGSPVFAMNEAAPSPFPKARVIMGLVAGVSLWIFIGMLRSR